jgi:hypothetical protein
VGGAAGAIALPGALHRAPPLLVVLFLFFQSLAIRFALFVVAFAITATTLTTQAITAATQPLALRVAQEAAHRHAAAARQSRLQDQYR